MIQYSMIQYTQYQSHNTNDWMHTYQWSIAYLWMSHVTRIRKPCRTHVVGIKTSRHAHLRVMSHVPNSHVSQVNESCHAYRKVMSRISFRHVVDVVDTNQARTLRRGQNQQPLQEVRIRFSEGIVLLSALREDSFPKQRRCLPEHVWQLLKGWSTS